MTNVLMGRIGYHRTLPTLLMMFSEQDRTLAIKALQRLDMVSHGLHRADELSGGQQQRVAIAARSCRSRRFCWRTSRSPRPAQRHIVMDSLRRINKEDGIGHLESAPLADGARLLRPHHRHAQGRDRVRRHPAQLTPAVAREIYGTELADSEAIEEEERHARVA